MATRYLFLYFLSVCSMAMSQTTTIAPIFCCKAMIKSCLACSEGITVAAFCEKHPGEYDCPSNTTNPVVCCEAMLKSCLACSEGVSVEEYCKLHPNEYDCAALESAASRPTESLRTKTVLYALPTLLFFARVWV